MPTTDTVCGCNHWYEEHEGEGCCAPGCECERFIHSPELSTAAAIADRGGDPELWPEWVKSELGCT